MNNSEFWTYCGIKIPTNIKSVPSIDGINTSYSDGSETEMCGINVKPYTLKEYQNKYSIVRSNGELVWKEGENLSTAPEDVSAPVKNQAYQPLNTMSPIFNVKECIIA